MKHTFQIYIYIDIHIYKKKILDKVKRSVSKHNNKNNNLDHSVDIKISETVIQSRRISVRKKQ